MSLNKNVDAEAAQIIGERLKNFKPIGWLSMLGTNLSEGAEWGACPDCGEECVWFEGKPTALHKGGIPEEDE